MTVYLYGDDFEAVLSAIYDAGTSGMKSREQRLELEGSREPELFCRYVQTEKERRKAESVAEAVRKKLSPQVFRLLWEVSLSGDPEKGDVMYRFLVDGFREGPEIIHMLTIPSVWRMHELRRAVFSEAHLLTGFVRFGRLPEGVLAGRIGPKNDVLALLSEHFEDRLSGENWLLWDEKRDKAAAHRAGGETVLLRGISEQTGRKVREAGRQDPFAGLWKSFVDTVAIKERENRRCQMTHMPLRYREYMTEWQLQACVPKTDMLG